MFVRCALAHGNSDGQTKKQTRKTTHRIGKSKVPVRAWEGHPAVLFGEKDSNCLQETGRAKADMSAAEAHRGHQVNWMGLGKISLRKKKSRRPESNWRPTLYESVALPTELRRRNPRRTSSPGTNRGVRFDFNNCPVGPVLYHPEILSVILHSRRWTSGHYRPV